MKVKTIILAALAVLTLVSSTSIVEGGAHDVIQKDTSPTIK